MTELSTYQEFEDSSVENRRLLRQEELILAVTEGIVGHMEEQQISKSDLARRLGKSKGFVSQILSGGRNLTLRTVADVLDALDACPTFKVCCGIQRNWRSVEPDELGFPLKTSDTKFPALAQSSFSADDGGLAA